MWIVRPVHSALRCPSPVNMTPLGRRIAMRDSAGGVKQYLYDDDDRLTSMVLPSGKTAAMTYDDAGRRTSVAYPNELNTAIGFDTPA